MSPVREITCVGSFHCPQCLVELDATADDQFANDVEDQCARPCPECGAWYQIRCVEVEIYVEVRAANKQQEDQSE